MTYQIKLLEHCLCAWEDYWFLLELLARAQPDFSPTELRGAVANHASLRTTLLELGVASAAAQSEFERFLPPPDLADGIPSTVANLPNLLAGWSAESRRIYRMNSDVQAVLKATSLHRMRWEDISLPFPTFGIELETPFKDPDGEEFSLVFLNTRRTAAGEIWVIQSFSSRCAEYKPLPVLTRQQLRQKLARGKFSELHRQVTALMTRFSCIGGYSFSINPTARQETAPQETGRQELVARTIARLAKENNLPATATPAFEQMLRVVVGLALYLKALPPGTPHLSEWTGRHLAKVLDRRAVVSESQICTVSSVYQLTPEERQLLLASGEASAERLELAMSAHFRSAYWRRARGTGNDPLAPKVEHVRWTIVRRDRLPETGALPHGTVQVL